MIQIELNDSDAVLFRDFRAHQDDFQELLGAGAFGGLESGKITVNIHNGKIQNIVVERRVFTRVTIHTPLQDKKEVV